MTDTQFNERHGVLATDKTLQIQRRLPGPIERVWAYLTESDLRRQWLASGTMPLQPGASFELVWRNDALSTSAAERPDGFSAESRATCQFIEVDPPRRMRYIWPGVGEVSMELEVAGADVLLTLTHRQLVGERLILNVSAGWHAHLALLVARLENTAAPSLWATWKKVRAEYEELSVLLQVQILRGTRVPTPDESPACQGKDGIASGPTGATLSGALPLRCLFI